MTDKNKKNLKEWVTTIILSITTYLFLSIFIFSIKVDGYSMYPTFKHGDFIISVRGYLNTEYQRNDVVIFKSIKLGKPLIKRIIGCPGDNIKIKDGKVYVNDIFLEEPYINNVPLEILEVTVPENHYFAMGDNRQNSLDSRYEIIGLINQDEIMGKAFVEVFPTPKIIE